MQRYQHVCMSLYARKFRCANIRLHCCRSFLVCKLHLVYPGWPFRINSVRDFIVFPSPRRHVLSRLGTRSPIPTFCMQGSPITWVISRRGRSSNHASSTKAHGTVVDADNTNALMLHQSDSSWQLNAEMLKNDKFDLSSR